MDEKPIKIINCKKESSIEVQNYLFSKGYIWNIKFLISHDEIDPKTLNIASRFEGEIVLLSDKTIAHRVNYEFYNLGPIKGQVIDSDKFLVFTKRKEKLNKINKL